MFYGELCEFFKNILKEDTQATVSEYQSSFQKKAFFRTKIEMHITNTQEVEMVLFYKILGGAWYILSDNRW